MQQRVINTQLKKREEVFRMLALGEATGLPVLLLGTHGVAKTQAVLDYIGSGSSYIIQTSMGTRPNDIRGTVDMDHFISQKKYRTISPITEAEAIVIDEVDKTNDSVRDMLLSIMREKKLFLGSEGAKQCNWKLFVGSCNKPPTVSPFWDRFVLRLTVERLPNDETHKLFDTTKQQIVIPMPNGGMTQIGEAEIKMAQIIAETAYKVFSDRTISYLPRLLKATQVIWELDTMEEATLKLTSLMCNEFVTQIAKKVGVGDETEYKNRIKDLEKLFVMSSPVMANFRLNTSDRQSYDVKSFTEMYERAIKESPTLEGGAPEVGVFNSAMGTMVFHYGKASAYPTYMDELNLALERVTSVANANTDLRKKWEAYKENTILGSSIMNAMALFCYEYAKLTTGATQKVMAESTPVAWDVMNYVAQNNRVIAHRVHAAQRAEEQSNAPMTMTSGSSTSSNP